ncbi:hypothetical protein QN412_03130 [Pseudomonas sp. RTB3]|uniref:hypothetical protein n=1 Tax=unclassified Pseudomonas TaxID=196821 RepID=UPI002B2322CE|nr:MULTISPECIES: hypothetical protein [unclassified Pseudomonas]MEB0008616.1 hypothetical protein [Pseudomonas sp. RTB2]MEB0015948.1 hypothetical protein [Pseudomonas sp. RTB3]MEB0271810.1 hypothetical protein [Pseudomonas sp. 5B4]
MEQFSPFEQGVLMALVSISATIRATPGFDGAALTKAAQYFTENPARGCDSGEAKTAYEWPLNLLKTDLAQLQQMLHVDKTRN